MLVKVWINPPREKESDATEQEEAKEEASTGRSSYTSLFALQGPRLSDISSARSHGMGIALSRFSSDSRDGDAESSVIGRRISRRIGRLPYKRLGPLNPMRKGGSWV